MSFVDILLLFLSKYNNSQLWDGFMLSCLEKGNYGIGINLANLSVRS